MLDTTSYLYQIVIPLCFDGDKSTITWYWCVLIFYTELVSRGKYWIAYFDFGLTRAVMLWYDISMTYSQFRLLQLSALTLQEFSRTVKSVIFEISSTPRVPTTKLGWNRGVFLIGGGFISMVLSELIELSACLLPLMTWLYPRQCDNHLLFSVINSSLSAY